MRMTHKDCGGNVTENPEHFYFQPIPGTNRSERRNRMFCDKCKKEVKDAKDLRMVETTADDGDRVEERQSEQRFTRDEEGTTNRRSLTIQEWTEQITEWAKRKGWHAENLTNMQIAEKLLLVITELSEAFEELRAGHTPDSTYFLSGKPEGFGIEMADATIRIFHLMGMLGIDMDSMIATKMVYNETRPFRHGKTC